MNLTASVLALMLGTVPVVAAPGLARQQPAAAPAPAIVLPAPAPVAVPVTAAPAPAPAATEAADTLAPGTYLWQPEAAPLGAVEMVVSIPQQRAYVYRGGILIGITTVSTGRPGHRTPTGRFPILEKRQRHFSNRYNNAPMPFMQRLTWDGIALHAGEIPGRPASHGCVRLPLAFARHLFGVTRVGATVHIVAEAPSPETALRLARGEPPAPLMPLAATTMAAAATR